MKLPLLLSVCVVIVCVHESEGFKLVQKLRNFLHPTAPTISSTTIPENEKKNDLNSDEDSSVSQSQENQEGSFPNNKYNSNFSNKRNPYNREETTKRNTIGDFNTASTKSYDYNTGHNPNPDKGYGTNNEKQKTNTGSSDEDFSYKGVTIADIKTSIQKEFQDTWIESGIFDQSTSTITPEGSSDVNKNGQLGSDTGGLQLTTSISTYNLNIPQQHEGVDDVTSTTQRISQGSLEGFDHFGQSTSEKNPYNSQDQTYVSQMSVFGDKGRDTTPSTTEQPPSYNYVTPKSTPRYEAKDYSGVQPGLGGNFGASSAKGRKYNDPLETNPSYSATQGSTNKNNEDVGGVLLFPDDPFLNRDEKNERTYNESESGQIQNNKLLNVYEQKKSSVPVSIDDGRTIINAPNAKAHRPPA